MAASCRVRDTGIGMAADQLPHVFERFHRVSQAKAAPTKAPASGWRSCRRWSKLHGGRVDVESTEGRGTEFTVSVPFGRHSRVDQAPSRTSTRVHRDGRARLRRGGLALVARRDGESAPRPATAASLRAVIGERPARGRSESSSPTTTPTCATTWSTPRAALGSRGGRRRRSRARGHASRPADLVLTDVMMPALDGFGLLQRAAGGPVAARRPVILLSARAAKRPASKDLGPARTTISSSRLPRASCRACDRGDRIVPGAPRGATAALGRQSGSAASGGRARDAAQRHSSGHRHRAGS